MSEGFGNNKRVVQELIDRDGTKCHYCGCELVFKYSGYVENGYSIDHVKAKAMGGSEDLDNLLLACRSCNSRKGSRDYAIYMMKRDTDRTLLFLMGDEE
jgi:5-methylcytosine-specific restriction endonuclease McrA